MIAGLAALLAALAGSTPAALEPVRLLSVTAQGPAVVIEATDPVAYTVSRPDAVTLVVDLRNAVIADAISRVEPRGPVAALRLEQTKAADGLGVARVRIALSRAVEYRVKSSRNSIRVELAAAAAAPAVAGKTDAPVVQPVVAKTTVPAVAVTPVAATAGVEGSRRDRCRPAGSERGAAGSRGAGTGARGSAVAATIERVRTARQGASTVVTISGDGKLSPNGVTESRDLPRRLIIDFPNVASRAAAQTAGDGALVRKSASASTTTRRSSRVW